MNTFLPPPDDFFDRLGALMLKHKNPLEPTLLAELKAAAFDARNRIAEATTAEASAKSTAHALRDALELASAEQRQALERAKQAHAEATAARDAAVSDRERAAGNRERALDRRAAELDEREAKLNRRIAAVTAAALA